MQEASKIYIKGNPLFPYGVLNQLVLFGGVQDEEFSESELSNPQLIFYINYRDGNTICKAFAGSFLGCLIVDSYKEVNPLTYIDVPESLPSSWEDAISKCEEARIFENSKNEILNEKLVTLGRLVVVRDIYRQGWTPKNDEHCYYITNDFENIYVTRGIKSKRLFSFQSSDLAEQFLSNFDDLLIEVDDMI